MHQQILKVELHCHMGGLPHPSMLRHLQNKSMPLALQADALAAFYPVENYDDFVRWFEGVRPLKADLDTFRPLLALHIQGLKAQNVVYTEIMIEGRFLPRDKAELIGKFRAFREWVTEQENGETQVEFFVAFGRNRTPEEAEKIADRILALYEAEWVREELSCRELQASSGGHGWSGPGLISVPLNSAGVRRNTRYSTSRRYLLISLQARARHTCRNGRSSFLPKKS